MIFLILFLKHVRTFSDIFNQLYVLNQKPKNRFGFNSSFYNISILYWSYYNVSNNSLLDAIFYALADYQSLKSSQSREIMDFAKRKLETY